MKAIFLFKAPYFIVEFHDQITDEFLFTAQVSSNPVKTQRVKVVIYSLIIRWRLDPTQTDENLTVKLQLITNATCQLFHAIFPNTIV